MCLHSAAVLVWAPDARSRSSQYFLDEPSPQAQLPVCLFFLSCRPFLTCRQVPDQCTRVDESMPSDEREIGDACSAAGRPCTHACDS